MARTRRRAQQVGRRFRWGRLWIGLPVVVVGALMFYFGHEWAMAVILQAMTQTMQSVGK